MKLSMEERQSVQRAGNVTDAIKTISSKSTGESVGESGGKKVDLVKMAGTLAKRKIENEKKAHNEKEK